MDRYQRHFSLFAFVALMLGITVVASAQYRNRDRGYGNYGGNISGTVRSLENQARNFEKQLDRALDRSRYDGSRREDSLNRMADQFKDAAENLNDEYEDNGAYNSRDEAQRTLQLGSRLGRALRSSRVGQEAPYLRNSWAQINNSLRRVADAFNLSYAGSNGRYGRNDRRNRDNGRWGRNDRRNDRWGRNDRNRRTNNRYGNASGIISNLKYKARNFEDRLDNDRYDRRGNGNIEGLSDRFKNAVDDLADDYNDRDGGYDEARKVLQIGEQLDRELSRARVGRSVRSDWNSIERDLRQLARAYNLRYQGNSRSGGIGSIIRNWPF